MELLEECLRFTNHSSDGFDSIANVGGDTGFGKSDVLAKFRYTKGNHEVTFKMLRLG